MNKEDYNKYYIQGSDHYLIPKDVFKELFNEMVNWKEESKGLNQKYLNAVADYETTMSELQELKKENKILRENSEHNDKVVDKVNWENQLLKKQLEEYENELEKADSITQSCILNGKKESEISYRKCLNMLEKNKNQQKEFIEYLENEIYSIEPKGTGINYNCEYDSKEDYITAMKEQSKLNTLKEILSKYKEIIGSDINVGSIGGKE